MEIRDALVVQQLLIRMPGSVVTHDMGTCKNCDTLTESGMYVLCTRCLRDLGGKLKLRLDAPVFK